jgi:taurine transport system permease protein
MATSLRERLSRTRSGTAGRLAELFKAPPARPGEAYGQPGQGASVLISVVTVLALVLLWWLVTREGWIKPLFLPSPAAVLEQFRDVATEGFGGATLLEHTLWSLYRVFAAFFLACLAAIPIGIAMGVNRLFRGVFDPPIEFYRPIPPHAYLPLIVIRFGIRSEERRAGKKELRSCRL